MKALFILGFSLFSFNAFSQNKEEAAIIKLLVRESTTWRAGDGKGHVSCWAIKPYSRVFISTPSGEFIVIPAAKLSDTTNVGSGTFENSNYNFSIHGDNAWVSHDEVSIDLKGNKTYSHEIKMVEKIKGEWKIVAVSMHLFKK